MKEDAERIIASGTVVDGSKPLFSKATLAIAEQLRKDCNKLLKVD